MNYTVLANVYVSADGEVLFRAFEGTPDTVTLTTFDPAWYRMAEAGEPCYHARMPTGTKRFFRVALRLEAGSEVSDQGEASVAVGKLLDRIALMDESRSR